MEITVQRQIIIKQDLIILFAAATILLAGYLAVTSSHYLSTSKIEEGTIIVRGDSVTTIIIPDKR